MFEGQETQEGLSLDFLTPEDGIDKLSRNVA